MTITFATLIFAFLFLFKGVQKNTIFLLYATAMVLTAYYCENNLGWRVRPFTKAAFMLFVLFHLPMINLFTFLAYGKDKRSAQRGEWRIPEIQLHTMELMGGTIGAIAGQKFFITKIRKRHIWLPFCHCFYSGRHYFLYPALSEDFMMSVSRYGDNVFTLP